MTWKVDLESAGGPGCRRTDEPGPLETDLPNYADFGDNSINDTLAIQFANFPYKVTLNRYQLIISSRFISLIKIKGKFYVCLEEPK